jgi:hypothetical protein
VFDGAQNTARRESRPFLFAWVIATQAKEHREMANVTDTFYRAQGRFHGMGAQILVGNGVVGTSPQTYEAVAEVARIQFGDLKTATFTRTHLRSPNFHQELAAGLRSSGPFTLGLNWRPDHESQSQAGGGSGSFTNGGLLALNIARTEKDFILRLPYGSPEMELPFQGVVTGYTPGEIGTEDGVDLSIEITPLVDYSGNLP